MATQNLPFPVLGSLTFFFGLGTGPLVCSVVTDFDVTDPPVATAPEPLPSVAPPVGGVLGVVLDCRSLAALDIGGSMFGRFVFGLFRA